MVIGVTGTPAAGKSTFAREILTEVPGSELIELNDIVGEFKLFSGTDETGARIVRLAELGAKVKERIKNDGKNRCAIIVGHLVPEIKLKYDMIIVVRANLRELIKRMERRSYEREKLKENIVSESIDYCGVKSAELCEETYEVEHEKEKKEMLKYIRERSNGISENKPEVREISKMDELLDLVTDGNKYGF